MKKPKCKIRKCLLADREEEISQYIEDEIRALILRLEAKNPDAHDGCLRVMVKRYLDYNSTKIFAELLVKYPNAKELRA